jgi:hypothetical protein
MKKFDAKSQKPSSSFDSEGSKKSKLQPNAKTKYRNYATNNDDEDEPIDLFGYEDDFDDDDDDNYDDDDHNDEDEE